jgi:glycosyltransferase involved in cell wall biosynthesis
VAVSRSLAGIAAELGARRENVHVLHNGVDIGSFAILPREQARERLGLDRRANLLLFVGNLLPVKGVDVLLDALLMAGKPALGAGRMTLAIAGDGPMRPWAERRVRRAGAEDAVRLLGHIPREQVALWMNAADVLVLPSRNEGCPNVVLEALACGTPVVASRVGAVPELVDDACGATVEPGEPAELARAVESVLSRQWDRAALRRRVEGMSWEANARGLHEVLLGAVARHGRAQ